MIADVTNAILQECKALFASSGYPDGTVILKTDFKSDNISSYNMPLLLVDFIEAESYQYPGGMTREDWLIGLNAYNYMSDPNGDDVTGHTRSGLEVIDQVRQHFSIGKWLSEVSPTITDLLNNYCFKFTLSGIAAADAIDKDGLCMGYRVVFDTVGLDDIASSIQTSLVPLDTVTQVDNPPFD